MINSYCLSILLIFIFTKNKKDFNSTYFLVDVTLFFDGPFNIYFSDNLRVKCGMLILSRLKNAYRNLPNRGAGRDTKAKSDSIE